MIVKHQDCSKDNKYQDEKYGKQYRIVNKMGLEQYRCTVCGKIITRGGTTASAIQIVNAFK